MPDIKQQVKEARLPEITLRAILLAIVLAAVLAAANTYLALKIGILTSASIPAAVIAMAVLRWCKNSNVLENNQVQTAASAGEAVAGGIVYTIPAMLIIHYWQGFGYWENFLIGLLGGGLGVFFSIPLRRVLMQEPNLRFPEGRAIAELLQASKEKALGIKEILWGSGTGALLELLQNGFKIFASGIQGFWFKANSLFSFGLGFSATMLGAGYLIGFRSGLSFLLGAIINWLICLPLLSRLYTATAPNIAQAVVDLGQAKLRYVGIGAMLLAGIYTLLSLAKPFCKSLRFSLRRKIVATPLTTDRDLPQLVIIMGIVVLAIATYGLLAYVLPITELGFQAFSGRFLLICLAYVLLIGFIFSAICGYFSGMVGVSASPGSAIIIAGMLMVALALRWLLGQQGAVVQAAQLQHAAAVTIIIGSIVTGAACIANDNVQDLKVGHILGSTPWKQQLMLMLGVLVAAAVTPLVMQLLYKVYGIAGSMPSSNMDVSTSLPAPPAALMAAVTQAVFHHDLPWNMLGLGMGVAMLVILGNYCLAKRNLNLSVLGIAIGMYLPITTSTALFLGGLMAFIGAKQRKEAKQRASLLACGLVAGSALMDVALAIPFTVLANPQVLAIMPNSLTWLANLLGAVTVLGLGLWFYRLAQR